MRGLLTLLLLASCATWASAGAGCLRSVPQESDTLAAAALHTFNAADSTRVARVLGLQRPWTLEQVKSVHCGDCIRGEVRDNAGHRLLFEWNGLAQNSLSEHCLYIGGYRDDPSAKPLTPGDAREVGLITVLRLYANSQIPIRLQYEWTAEQFNCGEAARHPELNAAQQLGLQALRLAYVLEGRWTTPCAPN